MSVQAGELGSAILFFFVFFGFTSRNPKKKKCKTYIGTSWWVRVCNFVFFVFFGFLEVFVDFAQNNNK